MEQLYYALAVAVVLFVGVTLFRYFVEQPLVAMATNEGFDSPAGAGAGYKFVMFGVDWCPHCVKAKPEFESLGATQTIGGKTVEMLAINPEKDENPYKETVKVSGYPTLVLLDGEGKATEYEGARNTEGFQSFLNQQMQ
jgi:thiol-disulfide isomerase/thioredoxin